MAIDKNMVDDILDRILDEDSLSGSGSTSIVVNDLTVEYNYNVRWRYDPTPTFRGDEPYYVKDSEWYEVTNIYDEDGEDGQDYTTLKNMLNRKLERL